MLEATWGFIRYAYGGESSVEPELFELVRRKLAWNNRCLHCSLVSPHATEEVDLVRGESALEEREREAKQHDSAQQGRESRQR